MLSEILKRNSITPHELETIGLDIAGMSLFVDKFIGEKGIYVQITELNPNGTPKRAVRLGQKVRAGGNYWAPAGTLGIVTELNIPRSKNDVFISVWFEDYISEAQVEFDNLQGEDLIPPEN